MHAQAVLKRFAVDAQELPAALLFRFLIALVSRMLHARALVLLSYSESESESASGAPMKFNRQALVALLEARLLLIAHEGI